MQINSTQLQKYSMMSRNSASQATVAETEQTLPTDTVTLSGNQDSGARLFIGLGVMVAGSMAGAQVEGFGPAIMAGSIFGGLAIMFS